MNSKELSGQIYRILEKMREQMGSRNLDALLDAHTELLSLLSENCWLKTPITGSMAGREKARFEFIMPIEVKDE